jgi:hypothetical protein
MMASLAPIHSESLGFFIAGQTIHGVGEVHFYSIEFDKWYPVQAKDDTTISYEKRRSGFPASKFFKKDEKNGYLLIAGGYDPVSHQASKSVKLYHISHLKDDNSFNVKAELVI